MVYVTTLPCKI